MMEFWIYSAILCLLAVGFLVFPFFRSAQDTVIAGDEAQERKRQNVKIFKERLQELIREKEVGNLDQPAFDDLKLELEQTLLMDVDEAPYAESVQVSDSVKTPPARKDLALACMLLLAGVSYVLYFTWGAYDRQLQFSAMQFAPEEMSQARQAAESGDMDALLVQLYNKLVDAPDNVEGWMLLSRTAMNLENYALAAEGFNTVIASLARNDEDASAVYGLLAQAHYFAAGGMSDPAQRALDAALKNNPNETNALGLKAIDAFDNGRYESAVNLWTALLDAAPDHPARSSIEAGIKRARVMGGLSSQTSAADEVGIKSGDDSGTMSSEADRAADIKADSKTKQGLSGPQIKVRVDIDPSVARQVTAADTVFVFARAETGPPMPLAASRHTVSELPLDIVLSDQSAMSPAMKLSSAQRVNVVARVSKSGQPIAQPGDIQGMQSGVSVSSGSTVNILIREVLE